MLRQVASSVQNPADHAAPAGSLQPARVPGLVPSVPGMTAYGRCLFGYYGFMPRSVRYGARCPAGGTSAGAIGRLCSPLPGMGPSAQRSVARPGHAAVSLATGFRNPVCTPSAELPHRGRRAGTRRAAARRARPGHRVRRLLRHGPARYRAAAGPRADHHHRGEADKAAPALSRPERPVTPVAGSLSRPSRRRAGRFPRVSPPASRKFRAPRW